ncbi:unnamed protein product [Caenorhabditis angaria]|uniref:Methyl-CpG binding protein 2/3 C-terminal domain-containing protein n=1 Tax=Caenorhabditis angaria TaxID=860376 RepID=A0A9P1MVM0_9PELO|nr:unnamed protein product [Caenorhabditis angaria]
MGKSDPLFKARGRGRPTSKIRKDLLTASRTGFEGNTQSPWRKTVSIFKQPVTQVSTSERDSKVYLEDNAAMKKKPTKKNETKPFQAMWAKSLSGVCAIIPVKMADKSEEMEKAEYLEETLHLAGRLEAATSQMDEQATVATICHTLNLSNNNGTFGQVAEKNTLEQCFIANTTADQPMIQRVNLAQLAEDIASQEKRVLDCRRRLQEVMKHFG